MPILQHQVQAGDTVSEIAKRFKVSNDAVSGFRSNDPNVIFPGENLSIQTPDIAPDGTPVPQAGGIVDNQALQPAGGALTPTPEQPVDATQNIQPAPTQPVQDAGQGAITETIKQQGEPTQPGITPPAVSPAQDLADQTFEQAAEGAESFFTPSGAEISAEGEIVNPPEEQLDSALGQFGISGDAVAQGFQTNPFGTISDIVAQVMQATGLPDARENINNISRELEELENERDRQIAEVQDDPFSSVSSKRQLSQNISDQFDKRINARVNRLTLMQSAHEDARQQAQFAATTAINLFGKQQEFQQDQIDRILDREEKQLEAFGKLNEPLTVAEAKSLGVPFGTTRQEAFGITPKKDPLSSGLPNTIIRQVDALSAKFDSSPIVKQFNEVQNKAKSIQAIVDSGVSGAGDLALVFEFMKSLDPTSVVRESEYDVASKAGNPFKRVAAKMGGYVEKGQILPMSVRNEFKRLSSLKLGVVEKQYDNLFNETGRKINMKTGQADGVEYLTDYKGAFVQDGVDAEPPLVSDEEADIAIRQEITATENEQGIFSRVSSFLGF